MAAPAIVCPETVAANEVGGPSDSVTTPVMNVPFTTAVSTPSIVPVSITVQFPAESSLSDLVPEALKLPVNALPTCRRLTDRPPEYVTGASL